MNELAYGMATEKIVAERGEEIPRALDHLAESISTLEDRVDVLRHRLGAVLRPEMLEPGNPTMDADGPPMTEVTLHVESQARRVERATANLNDLLARLGL